MRLQGLYEPFEFVLVRAPLLPVEARHQSPGGPATSPWLAYALAVASEDLAQAASRTDAPASDAERVRRSIGRYLNRMSTRPTPFGIFAGTALARWGQQTTLTIDAAPARRRTRLDMGWLMSLVRDLEARPEIRRQLRHWANPALYAHGGRLHLMDSELVQEGVQRADLSLRDTGVVRRVIEAARLPVPHQALVDAVLDRAPGTDVAKVEALLTELWRHGLLLTALLPPLDVDDPARSALDRLSELPGAEDVVARLRSFLDAADRCDREPAGGVLAAHGAVVEHVRALGVEADSSPVQVDVTVGLSHDRLSGAVGREVARTAELLLRLSPYPHGLPHLAAYRRDFELRYGQDREVPLLELVNPDYGLGAPARQDNRRRDGAGEGPSAAERRRAALLLELACAAHAERRLELELDEATLGDLELAPVDPATLPPTLDLFVSVAAESAAAIDRGDFLVVVGPGVGATAAGKVLGRFAALLGPDAESALGQVAAAEASRQPDVVWADLVYLPRSVRTANVALRPAVRGHQVVVGTMPSVPASRLVPLSELLVRVEAGRLRLRWPRMSADVEVCATHMVNPRLAPGVCQLLTDIGTDGRRALTSFDWGGAADLPFLPRIRAGRSVVSLARWRIGRRERARHLDATSPRELATQLGRWRDAAGLPPRVYLVYADNRLLLDLDRPGDLEALSASVRKVSTTGPVVLQEALPDLEQTWLRGPDGHFAAELCVSLRTRRPSPVEAVRSRPAPPDEAARLRPPGSDWLYLKVYGPPTREDDLLSGPLGAFLSRPATLRSVDRWFFVRYLDPDPHLRLRLHGDPRSLLQDILPALAEVLGELVQDGVCTRFGVDTYDRELERYGGEAAMDVCETLFAVDSRSVLEMLPLRGGAGGRVDRTDLAVLSSDRLLAALGVPTAERQRFYERVGRDRETAALYRQRKDRLRTLLGGSEPSLADLAGGDLVETLRCRDEEVARIGPRLLGLTEEHRRTHGPLALYDSLLHMHHNRLVGPDRRHELIVNGLLARTLEGLVACPVAVDPPPAPAPSGPSGHLPLREGEGGATSPREGGSDAR